MKDYVLKLDKPRQLRFGFGSLKTIRDKFGDKSLDQLMSIKMDEIPVLIWAGLKWEDASLTIDKVISLVDASIPETYTILDITTLVLEALAGQMGVDSKKVLADTQAMELYKIQKKERATTHQAVKPTIPSQKSLTKP